MNKKTTAIVVTIVAMLFSGCPGLFSLFMGAISAVVSFMPGANIDVMGSSNPQSALMLGIGEVVGGILFILVAAVAIIISWRRSKQ